MCTKFHIVPWYIGRVSYLLSRPFGRLFYWRAHDGRRDP
nr:MAG TPA: hypothetical protein [Caudoviricetes sp.]